jgi:hypothetical protein
MSVHGPPDKADRMPRYELRLDLPDRPGSLGAVATRLGEAGADIVSFEVIESEGGTAVDQFVLDLPAEAVPSVTAALDRLDGISVEVFHPVPGHRGFTGPLELFADLVAAPAGQALQVLVDGIPGAQRATWAVALRAREPQPERLAASAGAPALVELQTPWLPLSDATRLEIDTLPRRWGLAADHAAVAAAPLDATGTSALLVVRKQGPGFRQRELRVLAALALVAGRLAA